MWKPLRRDVFESRGVSRLLLTTSGAADQRDAAPGAIMKGLLRGVVAVGLAIAILLTQTVSAQ